MIPAVAIAVLVCLLAAAFFAGSETAITSVNRAGLHHQAALGNPRAAYAQALLARVDLILGTTLFGTNLMHAAATVLGGMVVHSWGAGDMAPLINTLVMTPLILVIGELVPKSLARENCDTLVPIIARPLRIVQVITYPFVWGTASLAVLIGRTLGLRGTDHGALTREDMHAITEAAAAEGVVPEGAVLMMQTVLGLGSKSISSVMVPLVDVVALASESTVGDLEDAIAEHGFARYPIFSERIDHVVGVVDCRQVAYGAPLDPARPGRLLRSASLLPFVRKDIVYVPETKPVGDLLHELHFSRFPMAAVVDEHGGVTGIVTTEDLIEEVVGEIMDERDDEAPELRTESDGVWSCDGRFELSALSGEIGYEFTVDKFSTVGGLVLDLAGQIPRKGDTFEFGPFRFEVMAMDRHRVDRVRISRLDQRSSASNRPAR